MKVVGQHFHAEALGDSGNSWNIDNIGAFMGGISSSLASSVGSGSGSGSGGGGGGGAVVRAGSLIVSLSYVPKLPSFPEDAFGMTQSGARV
jgi:hypothetical protein